MTEPKDSNQAPSKHVELKLSLEHAQALSDACDLLCRMGLGQIQEISYLLRMGVIPFSNELKSTLTQEQQSKAATEIEELLFDIKNKLGFARGASLGISPTVSKGALLAYEIQKVVDQALAYHRDPNPSFKGVNYDGLTLHYSGIAAPTATIVEAGQGANEKDESSGF